MSLGEVRYCLSNLEEWTRPEFVEKTMAQVLDTAMVVKDPYGTCLLIAPWNYPLLMVFLPLATMLAAGKYSIHFYYYIYITILNHYIVVI